MWAGLEDFARNILLDNGERGVVTNGPVFDGPNAEDDDLPGPNGRPSKDLLFGGLGIPMYFWKILMTRKGSRA